MGKSTEHSRDRLALLLGLTLTLVALGLLGTLIPIWNRVGPIKLAKGLSIQWGSVKFGLVVAAILLAPAGFLLAVLRWQKGIVAVNVEVMVILCVILLSIVSVVNSRYYYREDWTRVGRYGLSDQTIQALETDLKDQLTITVLASPYDLIPPRYQRMLLGPDGYTYLRQILKEYQAYSGKVDVVPLDPDEDVEKIAELFKKLDIKERPALIIQYKDKHEEIPLDAIAEAAGNPYSPEPGATQRKLKVEEAVTGAIMKLTEEKPTELCFTTGHGEKNPENYEADGLSNIRKQLEKVNYKTRTIDLTKESIPNDAVLVVAGPQKVKFQDVEVEAIRNFLKKDMGRLLLLVDPVSETGAECGLAGLLQDYDVTLRQDATVVTLSLNRMMQPVLTTQARAYCDETAADNDIVSKLRDYAFGFLQACCLETQPTTPGQPPKSEFKATRILKVAERLKIEGGKGIKGAWGETDLKEGQELRFNSDKGDIAPPLTVGVVVQPATPKPPNSYMPAPPPGEKPPGPRIVVIGDSDFASNRFAKDRPSNVALFSNCVAWLAAKKGKLGIPPKDIDTRRIDLDAITGPWRGLWILLFVVVAPTMVGIVLGAIVWVLRRK
ncbi:MAG: GldG family protein [Planctomycetes bacterium]|nr:GldG family protein [Planctomycetota bacterium]